MTRRKISVTVDDERLAVAAALSGVSNVSAVVDAALDTEDGLPTKCAANFDNNFTLGVDRVVAPLATLSDARMNQLCAAHTFAAGC